MGKRRVDDSASSETKKQKKEKYIDIHVAKVQPQVETPCLCAFPGTLPSSDTVFSSFRPRDESDDESDALARQRVVKGETEKVKYQGANFGEEQTSGVYCKYLVGVYSKGQRQLTVVPANVFSMRRTIKALAENDPSAGRSSVKTFNGGRAELGNAFGTAKAKQQLRDEERNAIKGDHLSQSLAVMQEEIAAKSANMPTKGDIETAMKHSLPIPAHNMDAETPADVYDLSSVVTDEELHAVPIKELLKEENPEAIQDLLPYAVSGFVNDRVMTLLSQPGKKDRKRLRVLVYISYLMAYYKRVRGSDLKNRSEVEKTLKHPPSVVLDGLSERYTELNERTPIMQDKILCFLLVLCLYVADYTVLPEELAKDLSLKPVKVINLLRNLGCKVEKVSKKSMNFKKASLIVPLKFPELRKGGPREK